MKRSQRTSVETNRREAGFTLVELLIAMLIMGLIVGAIADIFIVSISATTSSLTRLNTSHDRQLMAEYFPRDVESAASATSVLPTPAAPLPSVASPKCTIPGNAPVVLDLTWQGMPPTTTTQPGENPNQLITYYAADFAVATVGTAPQKVTYRLVRYFCALNQSTGTYNAVPNQPPTILDYNLAKPNGTTSTYPAYASCSTTALVACSASTATSVTMYLTDVNNASFSVSAIMRS